MGVRSRLIKKREQLEPQQLELRARESLLRANESKEKSGPDYRELLVDAARSFRYAAEKYENLRNFKKAESNYRMAARIHSKHASILSNLGESGNAYFVSQSAKRLKRYRLREIIASISVIGIIGGLLFLFPNVTGNVIGNMASSTSNFIGIVLIIIGLVCGFFWMRIRR